MATELLKTLWLFSSKKRKRNQEEEVESSGGSSTQKIKVLKSGSVWNDCESVGDNFEYSFKHIQKMLPVSNESLLTYNFVWTDKRAKLLIDTYHSYLEHDADDSRDFGSHKRCLKKLKEVFDEDYSKDSELKSTNAGYLTSLYIELKATDDVITSKLDEFATTYLHKHEIHSGRVKYGELKKILKEKWSQFKLLLQHEKFEYYRPLNAPPRAIRATRPEDISCSSSSTKGSSSANLYWTDELLQLLVHSYYLYLKMITAGTAPPKRKDCLNHVKRSLNGLSFEWIESKLSKFFANETCEYVDCLRFRKRLGKEFRDMYEGILNHAHKDVYKKENGSSSKSSTRNASSSSKPSPQLLAACKKSYEAEKLSHAVRELGYEGPEFALAACALSTDGMHDMFWRCQGDERRAYVEQCMKNQKWRTQGL